MGRMAVHQTFVLKVMLEFDFQERRKLFDFYMDRIFVLDILFTENNALGVIIQLQLFSCLDRKNYD